MNKNLTKYRYKNDSSTGSDSTSSTSESSTWSISEYVADAYKPYKKCDVTCLLDFLLKMFFYYTSNVQSIGQKYKNIDEDVKINSIKIPVTSIKTVTTEDTINLNINIRQLVDILNKIVKMFIDGYNNYISSLSKITEKDYRDKKMIYTPLAFSSYNFDVEDAEDIVKNLIKIIDRYDEAIRELIKIGGKLIFPTLDEVHRIIGTDLVRKGIISHHEMVGGDLNEMVGGDLNDTYRKLMDVRTKLNIITGNLDQIEVPSGTKYEFDKLMDILKRLGTKIEESGPFTLYKISFETLGANINPIDVGKIITIQNNDVPEEFIPFEGVNTDIDEKIDLFKTKIEEVDRLTAKFAGQQKIFEDIKSLNNSAYTKADFNIIQMDLSEINVLKAKIVKDKAKLKKAEDLKVMYDSVISEYTIYIDLINRLKTVLGSSSANLNSTELLKMANETYTGTFTNIKNQMQIRKSDGNNPTHGKTLKEINSIIIDESKLLNLPLDEIKEHLERFRNIELLLRGNFNQKEHTKRINSIKKIRVLKPLIDDFTGHVGNRTFYDIDTIRNDLGLSSMSELSTFISSTLSSITASTQQIQTLTGSMTTDDLKSIFLIDDAEMTVKLNALNSALASTIERINNLHKEKGETLEKVYGTIDIATNWYTGAVARAVQSPAMALPGSGVQRTVSAGGGYAKMENNIKKSRVIYDIITKLSALNNLINAYKLKVTNIIDTYSATIQMIKRCILYTFYILTLSKEITESRYVISKSMLTSTELNNMINNIEKKKGRDPDYSLIYARALNFLKYLRENMSDDNVLIVDPYKKSIYDIVLCCHIDEVLAR